VLGGDIYFIDTEARRALHYADRFKFQHVDFRAPFGPLDYIDAIQHCRDKGGRVIIIDSMTHEHDGEGGVMWQSEDFLDKKCGDDLSERQRNCCDGVPTFQSDRKEEQDMIKMPAQFRGWFTPGVQLDESVGERFAQWAKGAPEPAPTAAPMTVEDERAEIDRMESVEAIVSRGKSLGLTNAQMAAIVQDVGGPDAKIKQLDMAQLRAVADKMEGR
jgi:hypothetical protein